MTKISPCPFCGKKKVKLCFGLGATYSVECQSCEASGPRAKIADNAITIWNIRAEVADLRKQLGKQSWQPIETAPKDEVVLICGRSTTGMYYVSDAKLIDGMWCLFHPDSDDYCCETVGGHTHWMPIPAPPVSLPDD